MGIKWGGADGAGQTRGELRKEETRRRILDAALEVFAERGYYEAVVDEIVRVSQTSKGAFYHHFPSKQDIYLKLVDELIGRLAGRIEAAIGRERGAAAKVDAALGAVFESFASHQQLARILLVDVVGLGRAFDRKLLAARASMAGVIQRYLDEAVADGSIPPLDTEVAAYAWLGAINEVVVRWLHTGDRTLLERARPSLREMLLRSVGARPGDDSSGTDGAGTGEQDERPADPARNEERGEQDGQDT